MLPMLIMVVAAGAADGVYQSLQLQEAEEDPRLAAKGRPRDHSRRLGRKAGRDRRSLRESGARARHEGGVLEVGGCSARTTPKRLRPSRKSESAGGLAVINTVSNVDFWRPGRVVRACGFCLSQRALRADQRGRDRRGCRRRRAQRRLLADGSARSAESVDRVCSGRRDGPRLAHALRADDQRVSARLPNPLANAPELELRHQVPGLRPRPRWALGSSQAWIYAAVCGWSTRWTSTRPSRTKRDHYYEDMRPGGGQGLRAAHR